MSDIRGPHWVTGYLLVPLTVAMGMTGALGALFTVLLGIALTEDYTRGAAFPLASPALWISAGVSLLLLPALWLLVAMWSLERRGRVGRVVTIAACAIGVPAGVPSLLAGTSAVVMGGADTSDLIGAALLAQGCSLVLPGALAAGLVTGWHLRLAREEMQPID